MKRIRNRAGGFSLVEVTLALAVIAIGLVAILGVMPHGLQASRDAADNTMVATIVQDIFSDIRSRPFTAATPFYGLMFNPSTYSGNLSLYFDQKGAAVVGAARNAATVYYLVNFNFQPQGPTPATLTRVTATAIWRVNWNNLAAGGQNTNVFSTQLAYYDNP